MSAFDPLARPDLIPPQVTGPPPDPEQEWVTVSTATGTAEETVRQLRDWVDRGHYPPGAKQSEWLRGFLAARAEVRRILDGGDA